MFPQSVLGTIRRAEYVELAALFFIHAMAMGMWFVPLSTLLDAHGLGSIRPYAFATSSLAAFVSPLMFGAMADRHVSPVVVVRGLAAATAAALLLVTTAIKLTWPAGWVLGLIQLYALCSAPTFSISTTIVLSRLRSSAGEFGPIRAMATLGWMTGCWIISALDADASVLAGYVSAATWLLLSAFTFFLPAVAPPKSTEHLTWRQRLGWDALVLFKQRDHRVVFITAALFNVPLAALLPFTPPHLRELGLQHTSAWMSLAQVTEVIALFALAGLLVCWRLKWTFALGLSFGLLRCALCALDSRGWVLAGTSLHGAAFACVLITSQIYLAERVEAAWQARAQALMTLMSFGLGNLVGYLGTGWWFNTCTAATTRWPVFWGGLAVLVALVMGYFLTAYQGTKKGLKRAPGTDSVS